MEEMHGNASPIAVDGADDKNKMPRHPRWTRQETFILIQSKKVIENGFGRARRSSVALASDQHEPKWDSVSSYCRQHGVNKSAVQCRKRWSNMVGDYRKIKTWESGLREQTGSFWSMRSDLRRERKMPGFFDREVYDALDGKAFNVGVIPLALYAKNGDGAEAAEEEGEEDEEEEGEGAAGEDDLFSDFEQFGQEEINNGSPNGLLGRESPAKNVSGTTTKQKQAGSNSCRGSASHEGQKRRRLSVDGSRDTNMEEKLIKVLERNSEMLNAQLVAQNMNSQLDREQRKDQTNRIVAAISKISDALMKIADKL